MSDTERAAPEVAEKRYRPTRMHSGTATDREIEAFVAGANWAIADLRVRGYIAPEPSRVPPEPGGRIANAWQLAHVLSEQLDDAAPLNMQRQWVPFAERLWARLTTRADQIEENR